eukprot:GEZU01020002.1.p1 GENE.GEZU01020002.1~~GEZU01020002.1.p1  ORF type:complete len:392 (+),score=81.57 GEZU01020002.1:368-1543(+)
MPKGGYHPVTSLGAKPVKKPSAGASGGQKKFVVPFKNRPADENDGKTNEASGNNTTKAQPKKKAVGSTEEGGRNILEELFPDGDIPDRMKNCEPRMVELIMNEIIDNGQPVTWDDIAGLDFAKSCVKEIVVWPMLRPDIFTGLRGPPKGLLLFGPPGTGKTLIGKAIAHESGATFFSISASSLMSKWIGEGEKMVRTLFAVASWKEPAVIFIDEIDSLLTARSEGEMEASRRLKTEFLVQLDGAATSSNERILVLGATNRPQEIDEAARRRMVKRLYIPLPDAAARRALVRNLMKSMSNTLSEEDFDKIVEMSDGYSGSDIRALCTEAAMGPIRSLGMSISTVSADSVRPINFTDFELAFKQVRASVSQKDLDIYVEWNKQYGSFDIQDQR